MLAGTAVATVGLLSPAAQAQSVWGGAGSTTNNFDYGLSSNWSTSPAYPAAAGSSAQFGDGTGGTGGAASSAIVVTAGPVTADSWTFLANSQSYTITGASTIFSNAATLTNNASAGQAISIANNMTGTTLSQAGASTLTVSGTNSFTNTSVTAGIFSNAGSLTSTIDVGAGALFSNELTVTGTVTNAGTFNNNGAGTVSGLFTNTVGVTTNFGQLNGGVSVSGDSVTNYNLISGTVAITGTGGVNNNRTIAGAVNNAGFFINNPGATVSGLLTNTAGSALNSGQLNGGVSVSGGAVSNNNTVSGGVTVSGTGTYTQIAGSTTGTVTNGNIFNLNGGTTSGGNITNNATFNIGGTSGTTGTFGNAAAGSRLRVNAGTYTVSGLITNSGTNAAGGILVVGGATLQANGGITNTAGATIINNGTVNDALNNAGRVTNNAAYNAVVATNTGTIANMATGTWTGNVTSNASNATGITNDGIWIGDVQANTGTINNNLTWTGAITNGAGGTFNNNAPGTVSGQVTNAGTGTNSGTLNFGLFNTAGTFGNTGTINNSVVVTGGTVTNSSIVAGGVVVGIGAGTYTQTAGSTSGGLTNRNIVNANSGAFNGAINNSAGGIFNIGGTVTSNSTFNNSTVSSRLLVNTGTYTVTGLVTNNGTNASGGVLVAAGATLAANGGITNNATFVNNGTTAGTFTLAAGTLSGVGNTRNLTVNGGTFAPGNGTAGSSMTVTGSLVLQAAATYLVQVNPTTASFTSVTGAASFNGATVSVNYAVGSYISKHYTIVMAAGGVNGTFGAVAITGQPANMNSTLSYDANNAYLNLNLNFGLPGGVLNQNQQNLGNALTNFFNRTGGIPTAFASLNAGQLTQSAGEPATGSQQPTFNAMNQFMGVMTDPFVAGRGDPVLAGGGTTGYADEEGRAHAAKRNPNDALAAIYRKAPVVADPFAQRWSVWAAGYGGSQTTSGNAVQGSNTTSSNLYGTAVGADYRLSADTLAGFALAGGGTNFSVANGLGSGRSDLFQAGAFVRHNMGAAYLSGALAYGWQDITTNRTLTIAGLDQLQAKFNANAWSGRVEGGYRFVSQGIGLTPYAAGQFTTFDLPAYAEQAIVGANTFALAYAAKSVTATRSELGLRMDKSFAMEDGVFTLRGRAAWAHDYDPDRSIGATFQTLPGASFAVNGARQASDAVLPTASAEKKWRNGWSAAGTFEGEFSSVTTSYAGKGVVRYVW